MKLCRLTNFGIFDTRKSFPGKKKTPERLTPGFEVEFYTDCDGKAIVDGREYEISEGSLLCSKPEQRRSSILGFQCWYLHFQLPEDSPYAAPLNDLPDFYRIIDREIYGFLFESLIHHLLSEGYEEEDDYVNARLLELFYHLRSDAQRNRNYLSLGLRGSGQNPCIPRVLDFLHTHYGAPLTLSEIAAISGYSPNHFHRIFSHVMGNTPQEYLLSVRLEHAKQLLLQPEKSISEIAYECGFSSQSYFTEQFRKEARMTPGKYRKMGIASQTLQFR